MTPLRRHHKIAFNTNIIVNLDSLSQPPIASPEWCKIHPLILRATPRHASHNRRTQKLPHKIHPSSCLRGWHANTFLKDLRGG